jgi:hypothetical protein
MQYKFLAFWQGNRFQSKNLLQLYSFQTLLQNHILAKVPKRVRLSCEDCRLKQVGFHWNNNQKLEISSIVGAPFI